MANSRGLHGDSLAVVPRKRSGMPPRLSMVRKLVILPRLDADGACRCRVAEATGYSCLPLFVIEALESHNNASAE